MSNNKTLWLGLLIVWISGSAFWHVCKIKNLCDADFIGSDDSAGLSKVAPLVISDSSGLLLKSGGNFSFAKNGISAEKSQVSRELDSLSKYLLSYPNKLLTITGYYSAEETNSSEMPNLGIARANGIKNFLRGKGITDSLISLSSEVKENLIFTADSLRGGIDFSFAKKPIVTEIDLANEQRFESIFKPLDLYFPTASASYIRTAQNQKFITEAKKFLAENEGKKLIVIGHTDNEDSAEWNLTLSKRRARVVKRQFILMGIAPKRIIAIGKGELIPKESNETPAGKRANRRVTVFVK